VWCQHCTQACGPAAARGSRRIALTPFSPGSGKVALPWGSGAMVVPGGREPSPAWRERGGEAGVRGACSRLSPELEAEALVESCEE
jgi:hypothetical protein